jgi:sugar/nucleoside kinase (ribokinase family)
MKSPRAKIAVVGELNVDLIATGLATPPALGHEVLAQDFQMVLGSASAIFACGVARLGHSVTFISRVGEDYFGEFCVTALRERGIATAHVTRAATRTGVTVALSTTRDRALVTYLGAIAELSLAAVPLAALDRHTHLHLTSYFLQDALRPDFPRLMREAKARGLSVSFDPNSDPGAVWPAEIWDTVAQTDVLFVNETEAQQLTRTEDTETALQELGGRVSCAVIKLGAQGALGVKDGVREFAPALAVPVVDTTGAGDSFAAGFVHGYVQDWSLADCLRAGNFCGAASVQHTGGTAGQAVRVPRLRGLLGV